MAPRVHAPLPPWAGPCPQWTWTVRRVPVPVGDEAVIAVAWRTEGQLWEPGVGYHPLDDEPHRRGRVHCWKGRMVRARNVHRRRQVASSIGIRSSPATGIASIRTAARPLCWRMVHSRSRTPMSTSRQTARERGRRRPLSARTVSWPLATVAHPPHRFTQEGGQRRRSGVIHGPRYRSRDIRPSLGSGVRWPSSG